MPRKPVEQEEERAARPKTSAAEAYDEGQLADLPWVPSRTFRSGGAIIFVNEGWCKGCNICVEVCPKQVLGLDGQDKPILVNKDTCNGCLRCELLCPDFALMVIEPQRGGERKAAFMP
jgi:2-oxoglutarate ferredoxin oxidoreductase subunit delta